MSCDKCDDIHIAQRAGKQSDECKCSCHNKNSFSFPTQFEVDPPQFIPCYHNMGTGDPPYKQGETICFDRVNRKCDTQ